MTDGALTPIDVRRESLSDIVYDAIRSAIVTRKLPPGSRVSEASLSQQLSVSKTPVREALLRLAHIGLIEPGGERRSARVISPSSSAIRKAYGIRRALEVESARVVAARADLERLDEIELLAQGSVDAATAGDAAAFRTADRCFHNEIADATDNPPLARLIVDAHDLTWTLRMRDVPGAADLATCAQHHLTIVERIKSNDPEEAGSAMREHLEFIEGLVLKAYEQYHAKGAEEARERSVT